MRSFRGGLDHLLGDHRRSLTGSDQVTDQQAAGFQIGGDERALLGQIGRHIAGELAFVELPIEVGDPPHLAVPDDVAADRERRDLRQVGSGESQQLGDVLALRLDLKIELVQRLGSADLTIELDPGAGRLDPGPNRVSASAAVCRLRAAEAGFERHRHVPVAPAAGQLQARQPVRKASMQVEIGEREFRAGQARDGIAQLGVDSGQQVGIEAEAPCRCLLVVLPGRLRCRDGAIGCGLRAGSACPRAGARHDCPQILQTNLIGCQLGGDHRLGSAQLHCGTPPDVAFAQSRFDALQSQDLVLPGQRHAELKSRQIARRATGEGQQHSGLLAVQIDLDAQPLRLEQPLGAACGRNLGRAEPGIELEREALRLGVRLEPLRRRAGETQRERFLVEGAVRAQPDRRAGDRAGDAIEHSHEILLAVRRVIADRSACDLEIPDHRDGGRAGRTRPEDRTASCLRPRD